MQGFNCGIQNMRKSFLTDGTGSELLHCHIINTSSLILPGLNWGHNKVGWVEKSDEKVQIYPKSA